uniref:Uncharacterized protein n=1 Tax=viral metagenome TaxID=1070528 RepID=A0A6C0HZX9_9ZZZZ
MKSFTFEGIEFTDIFILLWFILIIFGNYNHYNRNYTNIDETSVDKNFDDTQLDDFENNDINEFIRKIICIIDDNNLNDENKINQMKNILDSLSEETFAKLLN